MSASCAGRRGGKVAGAVAAGLALGAVCTLATASDALAMTVRQVGATPSSITCAFAPGPQEELVDITGAEYRTVGSGEWIAVPSEYVEDFTKSGMTIGNLEPGVLLAQMRINYTCRHGGSSVATAEAAYCYDLATVADPVDDVKIAAQLFDTKKLKLSFANPGAIEGYQVKLAPIAGKAPVVTYRRSFEKTTFSNKDRFTTDYFDARLNTVYKVRVRTWVAMDDTAKTKVYAKWSPTTVVVPQPDMWGKRSGSAAKLSWTKIKGASSYTVYASTKAKSGFKKLATTSSTSLSVKKIAGKKLSSSKRYYFYVKAKAVQGKKTYSTGGKAIFSL